MKHQFKLRIRITDGSILQLGPGRADLLAHIQHQGSIAGAGRQMQMSYKRAWALVEAMNATFNAPLVEAVKGGAGGGGARLTGLGAEVLLAYRGIETAAQKAAKPFLDRLATAKAGLATAKAGPPTAKAVPQGPETG